MLLDGKKNWPTWGRHEKPWMLNLAMLLSPKKRLLILLALPSTFKVDSSQLRRCPSTPRMMPRYFAGVATVNLWVLIPWSLTGWMNSLQGS